MLRLSANAFTDDWGGGEEDTSHTSGGDSLADVRLWTVWTTGKVLLTHAGRCGSPFGGARAKMEIGLERRWLLGS